MRLFLVALTASTLGFGTDFLEKWSTTTKAVQAFEQIAQRNNWEVFNFGTSTGAELYAVERKRLDIVCASSLSKGGYYSYEMSESIFHDAELNTIIEKINKAIHLDGESLEESLDKSLKLMALKQLLKEIPKPYFSVERFTAQAPSCPGAFKVEHWIINDTDGHFSISLGNNKILQ